MEAPAAEEVSPHLSKFQGVPFMDVKTGGCLCGAIRYEFSGQRFNQIICHCRMCQRASGGPVGALMYIERERLRIKGAPRAFRSTSSSERRFCESCGSPIFFVRLNRPDRIAVFIGSLDDPSDFEPAVHVCMETAVPWLRISDSLPRFDRKPPGPSPLVQYDPTTGIVTE